MLSSAPITLPRYIDGSMNSSSSLEESKQQQQQQSLIPRSVVQSHQSHAASSSNNSNNNSRSLPTSPSKNNKLDLRLDLTWQDEYFHQQLEHQDNSNNINTNTDQSDTSPTHQNGPSRHSPALSSSLKATSAAADAATADNIIASASATVSSVLLANNLKTNINITSSSSSSSSSSPIPASSSSPKKACSPAPSPHPATRAPSTPTHIPGSVSTRQNTWPSADNTPATTPTAVAAAVSQTYALHQATTSTSSRRSPTRSCFPASTLTPSSNSGTSTNTTKQQPQPSPQLHSHSHSHSQSQHQPVLPITDNRSRPPFLRIASSTTKIFRSSSSSSSSINLLNTMPNSEALILQVRVVKGRDLAAKDRSGTSDPYLVLTLGDARQATSTISKTLNPEWNQTLQLPIVGPQSAILNCVCWDKDRFSKDYMGEFEVGLEELFAQGKNTLEPHWYPLKSKKPDSKKDSLVTGSIQLEFSLLDPQSLSAAPQDVLKKLSVTLGRSQLDLAGDDEDESPDNDDDEELIGGETPPNEQEVGADGVTKTKKKKRIPGIAKLKRKAKEHGYEFNNGSPIAGVLFIEIQKATDLPPERNATRTGFDMDPFVVISLGRKTYRTRVIRHNLNPVYDEKLVFQVAKHETNFSLAFSVVDRDNFSGNDYVGRVDLPLEKIIQLAPEADVNTGLYQLPEWPDGTATPTPEAAAKKSRFRLPLSRSASSQSLSKVASRAAIQREMSTSSLHPDDAASNGAYPPTSAPTDGFNVQELQRSLAGQGESVDSGLKPFVLPLALKNKEKWEDKSPALFIKAKYLPYMALRQQFWRALLRQYDADDSQRIDKVELTTMLDSLGSTLHESTINKFFERFPEDTPGEVPSLSFDEAVICLEDELKRTSKKSSILRPNLGHQDSYASTIEGSSTVEGSGTVTPSATTSYSQDSTLGLSMDPTSQDQLANDANDLADDRGEEHVIEIRECPICHQPRLNKRSDSDIITHIATCASQDWRQVNSIVMAGFVTASQAQRKWYSKVVTKIGYGGYKLGANSANILVQDRITGQINEEKMSVYVRLGIRLLYKGLKTNNMERKRIKKLLRSLSVKQGKKYDDPASVSQIEPFIAFHQLDMGEVLLKMEDYKNFNEFFYRALKPDARPCSAPNNPHIATSPADCRSVVFNRLDEAQKIWVKGRDFTVSRLLGNAYPEDAKRYEGGALGVFRLAPQDYHRFHIPVDGVIGEPKEIAGEYYTVNPMAIRSSLDVYGENVRVIVPIDSVAHGRVMFICIGAMMVGSTVITRKAGEKVARAEELGYFKFGGSTVLLLFEPGRLTWDSDLTDNSSGALETLIRVGMSVGHSPEQEQHTGDMQKSNLTSADKEDAQRRIAGGGGDSHGPAPPPM